MVDKDYLIRRDFLSTQQLDGLFQEPQSIWSLYGQGGIGKTTAHRLMHEFYEQNGTPVLILDLTPENQSMKPNAPISALEVLLRSAKSNMPHFERTQKLIKGHYDRLSSRLQDVGNAVEAIPPKLEKELFSDLIEQDELQKSLGLVWKTLADTLSMVKKLVAKREKNKEEAAKRHPEETLWLALLSDFTKAGRGVILVDTFEETHDIQLNSRLRLYHKELQTLPQPQTYRFEVFLALLHEFLQNEEPAKNTKFILFGRERIRQLGTIKGLRRVKHTNILAFSAEEVRTYFGKLADAVEDFPRPDEEALQGIKSLTQNNPYLVKLLREYIEEVYDEEDGWDWQELNSIESDFRRSEEGIYGFLVQRIAKFMEGGTEDLWKLTIPRTLTDEIAEVLYPPPEAREALGFKYQQAPKKQAEYGKDRFTRYVQKGILIPPKKRENTYALHQEVRLALQAYLEKQYGNDWRDAEPVLALHRKLRDYYDEKAQWRFGAPKFVWQEVLNKDMAKQIFQYSESQNFIQNLLVDQDILTNVQKVILVKGIHEKVADAFDDNLSKSSYHAWHAKKGFEEQYNSLKHNRYDYWNLLQSSLEASPLISRWLSDSSDISQLETWLSLLVGEKAYYSKLFSAEALSYIQSCLKEDSLPFNWRDNESFLKKMLEQFPQESEIWYDLGNKLYGLGRYQDAERAFRKSIEFKNNHHRAWNNLGGILHLHLEKYDDAEFAYREAIKHGKQKSESWNNLGSLFKEKGEYKKAKDAFMKAIEINSLYYQAWNNLGRLFYENLKDYENAQKAFEKSVEIKPDYTPAWHNLGILHKRSRQYEEAERAYLKATNINVNNHESWLDLGMMYYEQKSYKKAINAYEKVVSLNSKGHEAWYYLGNALYLEKRFKDSEFAYKNALKIKCDKHGVWGNMGNLLSDQKRYEEAETAYRKALEIKPDFHEAWGDLGNLLGQQERYKEAKECFQKALEIKPKDENVFYNLGCLYALQKDKSQALAYLEKAITLNPEKYKPMAQQDEDFQWLWEDEDFKSLVQ